MTDTFVPRASFDAHVRADCTVSKGGPMFVRPINISGMGRLCLYDRSEAAPHAELQGSIYNPTLITGSSLSITVLAHTTSGDTWPWFICAARANLSHVHHDELSQESVTWWFLGCFERLNRGYFRAWLPNGYNLWFSPKTDFSTFCLYWVEPAVFRFKFYP